jgi:hypothetical protein
MICCLCGLPPKMCVCKEIQEQLDDHGYWTNFGDVSRDYLGKQSQYGIHILEKFVQSHPGIIETKGNFAEYHSVMIQTRDIPVFIRTIIQDAISIGIWGELERYWKSEVPK